MSDLLPCILWPGKRNHKGYGRAHINGRTINAQRLAWIQQRGDPGPLLVLHTCGNRACVNLAHLYLGTAKDNTRDAMVAGTLVAPNRNKTHCKRGHQFSGDNLHTIMRRGRPMRRCVACHSMLNRKSYLSHKEKAR